MNLENYFISQFENKYIGDDGVCIEGISNAIYSKDAFYENVHFKTDWLNHYQIATRAMLVNISDAIAMNAKPKYALLSVAMPSSITKDEVNLLIKGFKDTADRYGIEFIGGDTISNIKLDITVTIISISDNVLYRKKIRDNYLVAHTGKLGNSYKDLKKLLNLGKIHSKSKFLNIKLRDDFIYTASKHLNAGMDISDGLYSDLSKLAQANRVGFKFNKKIKKSVACSGEEYEMLIAFDKRKLKTIKRLAQKTRTPINVFASSSRCNYKNRCKAHHF
jgi:thiamine-monophosphate kinase